MAASTASGLDVHAQASQAPSDAEACFSAAEQAQPLMKQHKLRAAEQKLHVCARESCPRAARTDCRTWLADVTRAEPTVVFVAREERPSGESRAVDDVRVSVDGEVIVPAHLEVSAVPLDPGVHTVTFQHAGFDPVEQRIDVREGERDRQVDVVFRASGPASVAPPVPQVHVAPPPEAPVAPEAPSTTRPVPVAVYGLAGAGLVAVGLGAVMEGWGLSDRSHLADTCQPTRSCAPSDVDSARTRVMVGDVALGVGALLFAGSAYLYLTRDTRASSSGALRLRFAPSARGVYAGLEGTL
ncbi:MAG TPA: hypothetical protein VGL81_26275 [Polyangiaceae bacterium]